MQIELTKQEKKDLYHALNYRIEITYEDEKYDNQGGYAELRLRLMFLLAKLGGKLQ